MENALNGGLLQWETTSMEESSIEEGLNGEQPKWKTTSIEDDLNQRRPQWKTTSKKYSMEDALTRKLLKKNNLQKDDIRLPR